MRNWDNWNTYKDLNGNTLHGCVQFNVRGGTTPGHIYDRDGTEIANPQLTDSLGRTAMQVFVDSDVVAYFYKYIGNGSYSADEEIPVDTSDESLWSLQYTAESKLSVNGEMTSNSAMGVSTMSSLRGLDPDDVPVVDGLRIVCLQGYYEGGDCQPVWYVWDPSATADDDNGSVIKYSGLLTGRWILSRPDGFVDSRHFGVFPQDSQFASVDQTTRIMQLVSYCNSAGLNPLFGGSVSHPYFIYNSLYVNSRNAISVSRGTAFVDKSYSNFYGDWDGDPLFVNGLTKVSAHTVRASWNFYDAVTYDEVFLDAQTQKNTFVDARVVVTVDTAGKTFTNCDLVSDGHLATNTFHNCVLRAPMFVAQAISPVIDDNCTIQPLDFAGRMDLWCVLRSQQHDPVIDVCMQTLDSHCIIDLDGVFIKNALFDNFSHNATLSLGLECCRGFITVTAMGNYTLTVEDSELSATFGNTGEAGVGYQPVFNIRNSAIGLTNQLTFLSGFSASNTAFTGNGILVNGGVSMDDCNVAVQMTVRGKYVVRHCTILGSVLHYTVSQTAEVEMTHCDLGATYSLTPAIAGTVVHGVWANNTSSIDSPILIDRTNIDPIDSHHTYTYSNNSGGFLPYETKMEMHEFIVHHATMIGAQQPPTEPYRLTQNVLGGSDSDTNGRPNGYIMPWYSQPLFDTIRMFRIGTDRFLVRAQLTVWPSTLEAPGSTNEYQHSRYHDAQLGAYYIDGYTWGIMPFWDDPTVTPPTDLRNTQTDACFFRGSLSFSLNNMPSFNDYTFNMGIRYECLDRHDR